MATSTTSSLSSTCVSPSKASRNRVTTVMAGSPCCAAPTTLFRFRSQAHQPLGSPWNERMTATAHDGAPPTTAPPPLFRCAPASHHDERHGGRSVLGTLPPPPKDLIYASDALREPSNSVATHIDLPRRTVSGFLTHPSRPSQMGATRALRPRVGDGIYYYLRNPTIVPTAGLSRTRIPIQREGRANQNAERF